MSIKYGSLLRDCAYICRAIVVLVRISPVDIILSHLGGVMVSVLATGPNVRWLKSGRGDGFQRAIKNPQHSFSRRGSKIVGGRAMAQVVSRRPLTAKARVCARVNPCGICGGQSGTGTGFSPSSSVFPCQYTIPPSLSKLISSGDCVIC
jgi:hypothetical protein